MTSAILAMIAAAELSHGIPPGLLRALCTVESGGNPSAINYYDGNGTHSVGLCQVKHSTSLMFNSKLKEKDLLNPKINAKIAAQYLKANYLRYNSWNKAIIAYNKGHANSYRNSYSMKVLKEWANQ